MTDIKFSLPDSVKYILTSLENAGYRADVVGGPVRDLLLGKLPSDYDITTNALPEDIKRVFSNHRTVDTGIQHGTVTLVLDGENYEITTYRIDGEYRDSRHPESVSFTDDITLDLSRRDFTVNAIAYNPTDGITDPFDGISDLKSGIIRAVGDPVLRFSEDALRILRCIRFASTLGFTIEDSTAAAAKSLAPLLLNVSGERIFTEWKKLLFGKRAHSVLSDFSEIVSVIFPELSVKGDGLILPDEDRFYGSGLDLFVAIFYLNCPDSAHLKYRAACDRLHTDSATRDLGALALCAVGKFNTDTDIGINRLMVEYHPQVCRCILSVERILGISNGDGTAILDELLRRRAPCRTTDLDISGNDVFAIGYRGSEIGRIMRDMLYLVVDKRLDNSRAELLRFAKKTLRRCPPRC